MEGRLALETQTDIKVAAFDMRVLRQRWIAFGAIAAFILQRDSVLQQSVETLPLPHTEFSLRHTDMDDFTSYFDRVCVVAEAFPTDQFDKFILFAIKVCGVRSAGRRVQSLIV